MPIERVSLRVQSSTASGDEITAVLGVVATRVVDRGEPVSSRSPLAATHEVTTWTLQVDVEGGDGLGQYLHILGPVLKQMAEHRSRLNLDCDLILMVSGRPLGWILEISAAELGLLHRANCVLTLDIYGSDENVP